MIQEILAGAALLIAMVFLIRKFFWKKKDSKCGSDNCGCG